MPEKQLTMQFSGKWAVVALIVVLLGAWHYYRTMNSSFRESYELQQIKESLEAEYASLALEDIKKRLAENPMAEGVAEQLTFNIEFASIDIKGFFKPDKYIRLKPIVNGGPPPDGKEYRYYKTKYSFFTGWRIAVEGYDTAYMLTIF